MKLRFNGKYAEVLKHQDGAKPIWECRIYDLDGKDLTDTRYDMHLHQSLTWAKNHARQILNVPLVSKVKWTNN